MAIIGVKYVYHNGHSVGKVSSLSVNMQRLQLSQMNQFKSVLRSANVSIQSDGSHEDSIFETSGTLRWCNTEMVNGVTRLVCHELPNVVLIKPSNSAVGIQDTISFSTPAITGQSWNPSELTNTTASNDANALAFCRTGVMPNG